MPVSSQATTPAITTTTSPTTVSSTTTSTTSSSTSTTTTEPTTPCLEVECPACPEIICTTSEATLTPSPSTTAAPFYNNGPYNYSLPDTFPEVTCPTPESAAFSSTTGVN